MTEKIQTLNYCTHAIEDLYKEIETFRSMGAHQSAKVLENIIQLLQHSVKFILPNCADIILDEDDDIRQSHLDLMHLPFPCVAFEAPWFTGKELEQFPGFAEQQVSNRRIALCWSTESRIEPLPGLLARLDRTCPGGGIFVVPVFWGEIRQQWEVSIGGQFIPYDNYTVKSTKDEKLSSTDEIAFSAMRSAGRIKPAGHGSRFKAEPFALLPEIFDAMTGGYGSKEKAFAQIQIDTGDEVKMLIQACCALNCANVELADVHASAALNTKRQKKGKQPFFSYKVLQLTGNSIQSNKQQQGGAHASPRTHLRRGHLRRLKDKTIWVRAALINAYSDRGSVDKEYKLVSQNEKN